MNDFDKKKLLELSEEAEKETLEEREYVRNKIEYFNQVKVLSAFISRQVSDLHFAPTTGYGYHDTGRDLLDDIYAEVFGAESAFVRWHFASGTHTIFTALNALLRPGEELLSITGHPYDTLAKSIGLCAEIKGSLIDKGVIYKEIPLTNKGEVHIDSFGEHINSRTKVAFIQRSRGYCWRKSLSIDDMSTIISKLKTIKKDIIVLVDNCYGEFVEIKEPCAVGADIVAGSLIKNPGGGICPAGGYVAGKKDFIDMVSSSLIAPGIGREVGASVFTNRFFYQGLYLAPLMVSQALQGMIWAGAFFQKLGLDISPLMGEKRGDIVQAVKLGSEKKLLAFCQAIQNNSPVDSHLTLESAYTPGYSDKIVMASGTFIQGASLELTADGPVREPYIAYLQGGLSYFHIKYAVMRAMERMECFL